jgi:predicted DNA-binding protein YlxM (UPF0122 family)
MCTVLNDIEHCKSQLSALMEKIEKDLTIYNKTEKRGNIYEEIKV